MLDIQNYYNKNTTKISCTVLWITFKHKNLSIEYKECAFSYLLNATSDHVFLFLRLVRLSGKLLKILMQT